MFYATLIKVSGAEQVLTSDAPLTLEEMHDLVGGPIEAVCLEHGRTLIVNEEGYMLELQPNAAATELADLDGPMLVGPAVLLHYSLD